MIMSRLLAVTVSLSVVSAEQVSVSQGLLNQLGIKLPTTETSVSISSVVGNTVELPCNLTSPLKEDSVRLVLWFKGDTNKPIYTYDTRGKNHVNARHWSDDKVLEGRAFFRGEQNPGRLVLDSVTAADRGDYKCRVDFQTAPTQISPVELIVLIPPEKPRIFDESNTEVRLKLGPYKLGDTVKLHCQVLGGVPSPEVTWWRDHTLVDSSYHQDKLKVSNFLTIPSLGRSDLHSIFTCQASNNNVSVPVSTSVKLDLTFGPLSVRLVGMPQALSAGQQYSLGCEAIGGRPAPEISWWLGDNRVDHLQKSVTTSPDGNVTTSTVVYVPTAEQHGSVLTCRAGLSSLTGSYIETSWNLVVNYAPQVSLVLGRALNGSNLKEGDDVYFDCKVKANPPPRRILWRKEGVELQQDIKAGIIISNQTLVLQKVGRNHSGSYRCHASNREGEGVSQPAVALTVRYAPVCRPDQITVYGVARHETVRVTCAVESLPDTNLVFKWSFNNSRESLDIQQSNVHMAADGGPVSVLEYTPRTEMDYGTLLCRARNAVGQQALACAYQLVPAGPPEPVTACRLSNQSFAALQLDCQPGFDGGLKQMFGVMVTELESGEVVSNVSSLPTPSFMLTGLRAEQEFLITVYATNLKGRSKETVLHASTPKMEASEKPTDQAKLGPLRGATFTVTPILGVLIGVATALILVSITIATILCCRSNYEKMTGSGPRRRGSSNNTGEKRNGGPDLIQHQLAADTNDEEYKQLQHPHHHHRHHQHHHCQHHSYRDLDMLNNIHTNISRLSCKSSFPDLTLGRSSDAGAVYSPFLTACVGGGGSGGRAPDTCSCSHVDTSSSHVSSRDEDSPDTPLVSEDGRSSSSSHHNPPPPPQPCSAACVGGVRMDRESAV